MAARRPFVRPMQGWWKRDPFFVKYMAREVTALFVYAYGLLLVAGLLALSSGEPAFNAWLAFLRHPLVVLFQVVTLGVFAYHTWSWFVIMPKTMPPVVVGGKHVAPAAITATGVAVAVIVSLAFVGFVAALLP